MKYIVFRDEKYAAIAEQNTVHGSLETLYLNLLIALLVDVLKAIDIQRMQLKT